MKSLKMNMEVEKLFKENQSSECCVILEHLEIKSFECTQCTSYFFSSEARSSHTCYHNADNELSQPIKEVFDGLALVPDSIKIEVTDEVISAKLHENDDCVTNAEVKQEELSDVVIKEEEIFEDFNICESTSLEGEIVQEENGTTFVKDKSQEVFAHIGLVTDPVKIEVTDEVMSTKLNENDNCINNTEVKQEELNDVVIKEEDIFEDFNICEDTIFLESGILQQENGTTFVKDKNQEGDINVKLEKEKEDEQNYSTINGGQIWMMDSDSDEFDSCSIEDSDESCLALSEKASSDDADGDEEMEDGDEEMENSIMQNAGNTSNGEWLRVHNLSKAERLKGVINFVRPRNQGKLFENCTPYQCFQKFFPNEILEHVSKQTNKNAKRLIEKNPHSSYHTWKDINSNILKAFIAVEIGMGLVRKPTLKSYFSSNYLLEQTPGFRTIFRRREYEQIRRFLHFADEANKDVNDKLHKIRPIIDMVKDLYSVGYNSHKELCVYESMAKLQGKIFFKQYGRKTSQRRFKIWSLCDSHTGYLLRFDMYKNDEEMTKKGFGSSVVQKLLRGFENKGHVVYLDEFYSSVDLFNDLRLKNIGACGTVMENCRGLPPGMCKIAPNRDQHPIMWVSQEKTMLASTWQDAEFKMNMLATVGDFSCPKGPVKLEKGVYRVYRPSVRIQYNKYMGLFDRLDQFHATYPFSHNSNKYYQIFWHFIIEVALVNGSICYNLQNPSQKLSQVIFRQQVILSLLAGYTRRISREPHNSYLQPWEWRLSERHFPSKYDNNSDKLDCCVCSIRPLDCKRRSAGFCRRKQTLYYCNQCPRNPSLCAIPCFELYHTLKDPLRKCKCK